VVGATGTLHAARVELDGHTLIVLDPSALGISSVVASDGHPGETIAARSDEAGHYQLAWTDSRVWQQADIWGGHIGFNGLVSQPNGVLISAAYNTQESPAVAFCDGRYLVVWADDRNQTTPVIYSAMYDATGAVVIPRLPISSLTRSTHPAVACNKNDFSVAWEDWRSGAPNIYTTLVTNAGVVVDPGGVALTTSGSNQHPSLTTAPTGAWIVWDTVDPTGSYIYADKLDTSSHPVIAPVVVDHQSRQLGSPDIATADGTTFYVVYQQLADIWGAPVADTGAVGSKFAIDVNGAAQRAPRIRWGGKSFLIAYEDDRSLASSGTDIVARAMTAGGVLGPTFAAATDIDTDIRPRIAGRIATDDTTEVIYARRPPGARFSTNVYGQTVRNGAVSGATYAISSSTTARETAPDLACATTTSCFAVYQAFDLAGPNTDRVMARVLGY